MHLRKQNGIRYGDEKAMGKQTIYTVFQLTGRVHFTGSYAAASEKEI